jgi:hypothetical protein
MTPNPTYLHVPDLRLCVTLDGKTHEVELYDPASFGEDDEEVQRFPPIWARRAAKHRVRIANDRSGPSR